MNICIVGLGYWGPNLLRNLYNLNKIKKIICVDQNLGLEKEIKSKYPGVYFTNDLKGTLTGSEFDAVVIATPVSSHYEIAREALLNGKHVLIEKPMTSLVSEAQELIEIAEKNNKIIMVDHTFIYSAAVKKIKEIVSSDELGDILYFDSVRTNLGKFQKDVNVLWDLSPHDISISNFINNSKPISLSAIGACHYNNIENIAYLTINYDDGSIAHFTANWLSPIKQRLIIIGGNKKMIVYNDLDPTETIKIYDKGIDIINSPKGGQEPGSYEERIFDYRSGDMYSPKINNIEPLYAVCNHFINCIETNTKPFTDGEQGMEIVRILEKSNLSIRDSGKLIDLV